MSQTSKGSLSGSRKRLIELMQEINFGRIENVRVRGAEPILDPPPGVVREIKFGAENGARPERHADDFSLKSQVIELLCLFDVLRDGAIEVLEIKHGLPFRIQIRDATA